MKNYKMCNFLCGVLPLCVWLPLLASSLPASLPGFDIEGPGLRLEAHLTQIKPGKLTRTRPHPSEELPVQPPRYPHNNEFLPKQGDFNPKKLKRLLGKDFDSAFMSTTRPLDSILKPNGTLEFNFNARTLARDLPQSLRHGSLNFLPERRKKRLRIKGRRNRTKMSRYLAAYTYCPLHYQWKDLGVRFWPRWIREGSCYTGRSCSIPEGMSCHPKKSTTKTVLWWHCRGHQHCSWIAIRYPIITGCSCGC